MRERRSMNPLVLGGLAVGAVGLGWWFLRGRAQAAPPPPVTARITPAEAGIFALSWAQEHAAFNGLTLIGQTRIRFFTGKPPRMSSTNWMAVGGTRTSAFYYVEFSYAGGQFLTVMIDALTGEKPPVTEGWVAGTMSRNFGL